MYGDFTHARCPPLWITFNLNFWQEYFFFFLFQVSLRVWEGLRVEHRRKPEGNVNGMCIRARTCARLDVHPNVFLSILWHKLETSTHLSAFQDKVLVWHLLRKYDTITFPRAERCPLKNDSRLYSGSTDGQGRRDENSLSRFTFCIEKYEFIILIQKYLMEKLKFISLTVQWHWKEKYLSNHVYTVVREV